MATASGAEMLELRTDYLENLSVELVKKLIAQAKSAAGPPLPIIVTCRDTRQGGIKPYPNQLRIDVLTAALEAGADFIDIEFENFLSTKNQQRLKPALAQNSKATLIISAHNFETNFDDITKLYRQIRTVYPPAIPKLVYTANHINDCFEAFDLLHRTNGERIVFCMGRAGLISRVITKKLGGFLTYASIDEQSATAPGQLTLKQFKDLYRCDDITSETELFGVIGSPVAHSLSPAIHNACFCDIGADKLYLPLLIDEQRRGFDGFMANILARNWLDFKGFSVTLPHKQNALDYASSAGGTVEPLAEKIGAVNTLLVEADGKLKASNTDYAGALDAITAAMAVSRAELKNKSVAVIGAGGVARAIVAGLTDAGAKVRIYNRTVKRAENLAGEFNCDFASLADLSDVKAELLINCTSIGMHPNTGAMPLPRECIKSDMVVFDTVYNPVETLLLKEARKAGAKAIDGLSMFINQALAQFKLFTGTEAEPELMRRIICGKLGCK